MDLSMKNFLVLFREPDGRTESHTAEEISRHQANWKWWFEKWGKAGNLAGGSGLTLNGVMMKGLPPKTTEGIHRNGMEIVGGYLLLKAADLSEAKAIMESCPIFEFGGYAEIRETQ